MSASKSPGDRGKEAEGLVKKELEKLTRYSNFDYERVPDARAARGKMSIEAAADFYVFSQGVTYHLEVKEMEHDYRLPKANFKRPQRARLRMRELCGVISRVLIYSKTRKLCWLLPISYFDNEETGSWDLRDIPTCSVEHAISLFYDTSRINKEVH